MSPSHPNRGIPGPASRPRPEAIRAAREAAGMTQRQAAALIYASERAWQQWEAGSRPMHPGLFELYGLKVAHRDAWIAT
jgi:putative transcriptional regulator